MKRILLRVAYDGTDFHGWQIQPGVRTVEGELNNAITELTGTVTEVTGASRTDAGVHAMGNVAVFDTDSPIPAEKFAQALNTYLPEDVKVRSSTEVPADFHPRKVSCRKVYEYRILCDRMPDPLKRRDFWQYPGNLDVEKMKKAASYLVGTNDYAAFCSVHTQAESTVRTVFFIDILEEKRSNENPQGKGFTCGESGITQSREIAIRICGNGFLYNMVRIIAGTLAEVGAGKHEPEWVLEAQKSADRTKSGPTAPPQGLTLLGIDYGNNV